ncbi:DUF3489 domain-containing protein [Aliiruegeria lutimaris]|uniref:DUF3489 domain-containing protein n=1 Tax=Aliiruegeria lutimaris TaxID=571298 RepID=A0A1G9GX56_9RHOB|nr:DUF3489 domain-containing protein [Aliiruegeria lutimaris]SDL05300.1 Protein of unknown function [Aliiruegeria lutimaris]
MSNLTDTQIRVLELAAARADALAMPLPKGLHGAAAKKAVARMVDHGFLEEVDANASRDEPLWRETGDVHGKTLIATEAGLAAIGLSPAEIRNRLDRRYPVATEPTPSAPRAGSKQARLIEMLSVPGGATVAEISEATGWQPHTVRGTISGTLCKKLGLDVISEKTEGRGRVYRFSSS